MKLKKLCSIALLMAALFLGAATRVVMAEGAQCSFAKDCTFGVEHCEIISYCIFFNGHYEYNCYGETGHCCETTGSGEQDYCGTECDHSGVGCGTGGGGPLQ